MSKNSKAMPVWALIFTAVLASMGGCDWFGPKTPTNIRVEPAQVVSTSRTEEYRLDNCGGTSEIEQILATEATTQESVMIAAKARLIGGPEVEVPMAVKLKLQTEVEMAYQQISSVANSRLYSIKMKADKGTRVLYTIEWEEQSFSSKISYMIGGKAYEVPYTYIVHVPKSPVSTREKCPTELIHLEAEQYNKESSHVDIVECSEGGRLLGWIDNGEWVSFEDVDFGSGGLTTFRVRVASAESGGQIEIRLDDPNGERIGVCQVYGTGGWQNWETVSCDLTGNVSGERTVYLVFKGGDTYLFNINWIEFVP